MATASLFVRQTSPAARPSLARIHKKRLRPLFVHLFIHRSQKSVGRTSALEYFLWSKGPKENFKHDPPCHCLNPCVVFIKDIAAEPKTAIDVPQFVLSVLWWQIHKDSERRKYFSNIPNSWLQKAVIGVTAYEYRRCS